MSELMLAVYESEDTAEHVLGVLLGQGQALAALLESAVVLRRHADCDFTVVRTERRRSRGQFWGVFWEAFLGLTFRMPDPPPEGNSNLGQLFEAINRAGLDEEFRARVRSEVRCGSSALALVAQNGNMEWLIAQLYLRPDSVVRVQLSPQQDDDLLGELGRLPPAAEASGLRPPNSPAITP